MPNRLRTVVIGLAASFLLGGCSSTGDDPDAGRDAGEDAGRDAGSGDDTTGDIDLDQDFGVFVPAGTRMCSMFGTTDMIEEHHRKARLTPRPGLTRLFREQESFEDDWIEALELAPDGALATPTSPGLFQRRIEGTAQDGKYIYDFGQTFELDGRTYQVSMMVAFDVEAGQAAEPLRVADEYTLSDGSDSFSFFKVTGQFDDETWPRTLYTCEFSLFTRGVMNLTVENGDRIVLDLRIASCPPDSVCAGNTARGATVKADFVSGAGQRVVDDFFRLAFSHKHHGIFDYSYFAWFDEPVGAVHGLWIPEPETSIAPIEVRYLGQDEAVLETRIVSERTYTEP